MTRDKSIDLLFGPQALSFQEDSFHLLKSDILNDAENRWIPDVIAHLPTYLKTFSENFPNIQAVLGVKLLEGLNDWIDIGQIPSASPHLPNVILSPLIVLSQLTQYSKYLKLAHGGAQNLYGSHSQQTEVVRFCTGLLSAFAVSSAGNQAQFQQYGAVAVRLAALIGALVDAQDALVDHGESKSLATIWDSNQKKTEVTHIMQQFSEVGWSRTVLARVISSRADLALSDRPISLLATMKIVLP